MITTGTRPATTAATRAMTRPATRGALEDAGRAAASAAATPATRSARSGRDQGRLRRPLQSDRPEAAAPRAGEAVPRRRERRAEDGARGWTPAGRSGPADRWHCECARRRSTETVRSPPPRRSRASTSPAGGPAAAGTPCTRSPTPVRTRSPPLRPRRAAAATIRSVHPASSSGRSSRRSSAPRRRTTGSRSGKTVVTVVNWITASRGETAASATAGQACLHSGKRRRQKRTASAAKTAQKTSAMAT